MYTQDNCQKAPLMVNTWKVKIHASKPQGHLKQLPGYKLEKHSEKNKPNPYQSNKEKKFHIQDPDLIFVIIVYR